MRQGFLPILAVATAMSTLRADTGRAAWLNYAPFNPAARTAVAGTLPAVIVNAGNSLVELSARDELIRGVRRAASTSSDISTSGIPDREKRAGTFPGRIEAEDITLDGYSVVAVTPWEAASGSMSGTQAIISRRGASTPLHRRCAWSRASQISVAKRRVSCCDNGPRRGTPSMNSIAR